MVDGKLVPGNPLFVCDTGAFIRSCQQHEALFRELTIPKHSYGLKVHGVALDLHGGAALADGPAWVLGDEGAEPGACRSGTRSDGTQAGHSASLPRLSPSPWRIPGVLCTLPAVSPRSGSPSALTGGPPHPPNL